MSDVSYSETWRTYQAAWEDVGSDERRRLLKQSVASTCVYSDPVVDCQGVDEIVDRIERARAEAPGISFRNVEFRQHHRHGIAVWRRLTASGEVDFVGASYARFGDDGRLVQITGFPRPA
jgi:hypothetical protein